MYVFYNDCGAKYENIGSSDSDFEFGCLWGSDH